MNSKQSKFSGEVILENMPDLAYIFDSEGKLVMWNTNIERVLGFSKSELPEIYIADFIAEPFQEEVNIAFAAIFQNNETRTVDYELVTKDGQHIAHIGTGSRITVDGQYFVVGQAINIQKLKDTEQKLNEQLSEIKSLKTALEAENQYLKTQVTPAHIYNEIIGESDGFKHSIQQVKQASDANFTVLIQGQIGTGKSLYASTIHKYSSLKDQPFISVNCTTLTHSKHLEEVCNSAISGTIFFRNINELSSILQAELVHYLKDYNVESVSNTGYPKRIIASTQTNLEELVSKEKFRKDLYFYLNVFSIKLPSLAQRVNDIPVLTDHFIKIYNQKHGKVVQKITRQSMQKLQDYTWPGNVRELENVIERAVVISSAKKLIIEPLNLLDFDEKQKVQSLSEVERNHIEKTLKLTNGRIDGKKGAALILDIHPETLRSRMRKLGINRVCT